MVTPTPNRSPLYRVNPNTYSLDMHDGTVVPMELVSVPMTVADAFVVYDLREAQRKAMKEAKK